MNKAEAKARRQRPSCMELQQSNAKAAPALSATESETETAMPIKDAFMAQLNQIGAGARRIQIITGETLKRRVNT